MGGRRPHDQCRSSCFAFGLHRDRVGPSRLSPALHMLDADDPHAEESMGRFGRCPIHSKGDARKHLWKNLKRLKRGANGRATDEFGDSTTDRPRRGRTSLGNELPSRVAPS